MNGVVVAAGFLIGTVFGATGLLSGFCLTSGLRDWWQHSDGRKVRTYALAMGVAVLGTQIVASAGMVDIGRSLYLQPSFSSPLIFLGGLLFGLGMVLANGCASRALVLLGKGNLRSLVVLLVVGVTAQMTLKGLIAPARLWFLQATQMTPEAVSLPALLTRAGVDSVAASMAAALIVAGALVIFVLSDQRFRRDYGQLATGVIVGALVVAGWLGTGWLGADDFDPAPLSSLTFVSPVADTVQYVMLSTGFTLSFGIALVVGVVVGSFVAASVTGRLALEGFTSPRHMLRSIVGAALMGTGGAMAYGCSVGQGLTGLSTLAIPSFIAVAGILAGAAFGLRGPVAVFGLAPR